MCEPPLGVQVVVRAIAENAGLNATEVLSALRSAHASGDSQAGLDIETGKPAKLQEAGIVDIFTAKVLFIKSLPP